MADPSIPPDKAALILAALQRIETRQQVMEARQEAMDAVLQEIADELLIRSLSGDKTDVPADVLADFLKNAKPRPA